AARLAAVARADGVAAERLPRLEARAAWIRSSGDPFLPDDLTQASLNVVWTPFASGTRAPRRAAELAEQRAIDADLVTLRRAIAREIDEALAALATAREALAVRERGVELASETLRVDRERYAVGRVTTNDLLDTEAELRQQQTARDLARYDVLRARLALESAVGGGVIPSSGKEKRESSPE
ncbi:MAG: TolC family protein, partial [Acidobacteriota bacterium]